MTDILQIVRGRALARHGRGRAVRQAAGVTLREMAAAVGVDLATLARWETGEAAPRSDAAARWATLCDEIIAVLNDEPHGPEIDGVAR